jgi:LmeA-like phospholipid-binding
MAEDKPSLGEVALSKIAEIGIVSQLDEVEELKVDIRTHPLKLTHGEVDSVAIKAQSMVMPQELRMETVEINTGTVIINTFSAIFGKIELVQPTDADVRVILTEDDINHALNSEYLRNKMQTWQLQVQECSITVSVIDCDIKLSGEGKIVLKACLFIQETGEIKNLLVTAIPCLRENGQRISLEEILFAEGKGLSLEFTTVLFQRLTELLDLRQFELMGMSIKLKNLDFQDKKLTIDAYIQLEQILNL